MASKNIRAGKILIAARRHVSLNPSNPSGRKNNKTRRSMDVMTFKRAAAANAVASIFPSNIILLKNTNP